MAGLPDPFDALSAEAKRSTTRSRQARAIRGPFASLMHHPALAERAGDLGDSSASTRRCPGTFARWRSSIVARAVNQAYEWVAHAKIARREGPARVIERCGRAATFPRCLRAWRGPPRDAARLAFESIPRALQDEIGSELGVTGLIELVVIAGHYRLIAGVLFAFDTPLPEGERAPF